MICLSYVACCGTRPWHQYENTNDHSGRMRQRGAKHANKQQIYKLLQQEIRSIKMSIKKIRLWWDCRCVIVTLTGEIQMCLSLKMNPHLIQFAHVDNV